MKKKSLATYLSLLLIIVSIGSFVSFQQRGMLSANTQSTETTIVEAEELNHEKKYAESLDLLLAANNEDPSNVALQSLLKQTLVLHLESQLSNGSQKIAADKHDIQAYLEMARAFALFSEPFRAMEKLTEGVIENPKSTELWLNIGLLELNQKRDSEAYAVFQEVLRLDKLNAYAYNNLAFIESRSEDTKLINLEHAHVMAKKAVSLAPTNSNFIDTLAEVEFRSGRTHEAIELMKEAIRLAPEEPFYQGQMERFEKGQSTITGSSNP